MKRLTFFISVALVVFACQSGPSVPTELHGVWSASGGEEDFGWTKSYTITAQGFKMSGYPPITSSADMTLIKHEGDRYVFRFENYVFDKTPSDPKEVSFRLSADGTTLTFENTEYHRTK